MDFFFFFFFAAISPRFLHPEGKRKLRFFGFGFALDMLC
jgi:hypothetical protein